MAFLTPALRKLSTYTDVYDSRAFLLHISLVVRGSWFLLTLSIVPVVNLTQRTQLADSAHLCFCDGAKALPILEKS